MGVCTSKSQFKKQDIQKKEVNQIPHHSNFANQKQKRNSGEQQIENRQNFQSQRKMVLKSQNSARSLNKNDSRKSDDLSLKMDEKIESLSSPKLQKRWSQKSIQSSGSPISIRGSIQPGVQFYSTNFSKKYSIVTKSRQKNSDVTFIENNKTGKRSRLEILQRADDDSIKYIYWLKSNQLEHQNILKCQEVHQDDTAYQVIYEDFEGENLKQLFHSDDLTEEVLANIACQMFSVLQYLKSLSLIHGNLTIDDWEYKFISGQVVVKLINYKPIPAKKDIEIWMTYFIPPDQIYQNEYTETRDQWAVIMILYILAKGELPFIFHSQKLEIVRHTIVNHQYNIDQDITNFSIELKNFFKQLIVNKNSKNLMTLEKVQQHEWIVKHKYQEIKMKEVYLLNILNQKPTCLLQQTIIEIMIQEFEQETAIQLQKLFAEFDSDMDLKLKKNELIKLFQKYTQLDDLPTKIDEIYNENGLKDDFISQFTFLSLAAPRTQLLNKNNLEIIFQVLSNNKREIFLENITKYLNIESKELQIEFQDLAPEKKLNNNQFIQMMEMIK